MRNTLETDRLLLDRQSRGQPYLQLGTALATATLTTVAASGYATDYPQQLTQVSWAYYGSGAVANDITVTIYRGTTQIGTVVIPATTASGSVGGVLSAPIDDFDFNAAPIVATIAGDVGNPAGSIVAITAVVTPL